MLKLVGLLTISAIGSGSLVWIDKFIGTGFLSTFIHNNSLELMGVLLGLNLATASSLVVGLTNIEINIGKGVFDKTIKEIKSNIVFMLFGFMLNIVIITAMPHQNNNVASTIYLGLEILSIMLFILYIYAFYEMTMAVFSMEKAKKSILKYEKNSK